MSSGTHGIMGTTELFEDLPRDDKIKIFEVNVRCTSHHHAEYKMKHLNTHIYKKSTIGVQCTSPNHKIMSISSFTRFTIIKCQVRRRADGHINCIHMLFRAIEYLLWLLNMKKRKYENPGIRSGGPVNTQKHILRAMLGGKETIHSISSSLTSNLHIRRIGISDRYVIFVRKKTPGGNYRAALPIIDRDDLIIIFLVQV